MKAGETTITLTARQAKLLRLLLLGEIDQPAIEESHRKTWNQIVAKLEDHTSPASHSSHR